MENSSSKNVNESHFGDFSTRINSTEKESSNEQNDKHEEGVHEFFRQVDAENHHFPSS